MHQNIIDWTLKKVIDYDLENAAVLEIGSRNINGTSRGCFKGKYIGIDFIEGPDVDIIMNSHKLDFPNDSFDVIICQEMLEHDSMFWQTLAEISRVLRIGGHFLMSTRGNGFAEHGWPEDYWRFMPNSGSLIAKLASCEVVTCENDPFAPGILLHAIKNKVV